MTPRNPDDYAMRTGVPDEFLHGDVDNYTPDWALSLEERFHNTVKAWLCRGLAVAKKARDTAAAAAAGAVTPPLPAMAFVPSPAARGAMDICQARANDRQKQRWTSIAEIGGGNNRRSALYRLPAVARRSGYHGAAARGSCPHGVEMLLGFRSRGGFPVRRRMFGGGASVASISSERQQQQIMDGSNGGGVRDDVQNRLMIGDGGGVDSSSSVEETAAVVGTLAASQRRPVSSVADDGKRGLSSVDSGNENKNVISVFLGGAADAYDSALSFVGCALVTSPLGKRYLNAYDAHTNTVPVSAIRGVGGPHSMSGCSYDLVGFSNIDPLEASARRGGGSASRL